MSDVQRQAPVGMRCSWKVLGFRALVLTSLAAVAAWLCWAFFHGWTERQLERLIQAVVPAAPDRQFVEAWFDRHGIKHGWSEDTANMGGTADQTWGQMAGLRD